MSDPLPHGWAVVPLAELLRGIEAGKSFKCEERPPNEDEIGVVKVSAVTWGEYRDRESKTCTDVERINPSLLIRTGDFLFSRANTIDLVGACVIAGDTRRRVMLSDKILRFHLSDDRHKPWVLYFLRSDEGRKQIKSLSTGNQESMRNIGQERIGQIELPVPPAAEQTRIVEKLEELLSDLDAGVAELKAAQRKLVQYRQSLLKAAVEGALTQDWRARNTPRETGADLLQRILRERRARWEQKQLAKFAEQGKTPPKDWRDKYPDPVVPDTAGLPELPEGWVWASVDQVCTTVRNGLSPKPQQAPPGYPILRINAVRPMRVNLDEVRYLPISAEEAGPYFIENGDLLATRYNGSVDLLGVLGVVRGMTQPTLHPDKLIRMQTVLPHASADWMEIAAATGESRSHIVSRVKTTAGQTGISGDDLKRMPIPLPPHAEQREAVTLLQGALDAVIAQELAVEHGLSLATAQRKNLLRAAFAGQLVPQDPGDEPASELLARIRAAKATTAAGKPRRKAKASA